MGSLFNGAGDIAKALVPSWMGKAISYDPILGSSIGKYIDPVASAAGNQYQAGQHVPFGVNPWAGKTPTLADSLAGYTTTPPNAGPSAVAPAGAPGTAQPNTVQALKPRSIY